LAGEICSRGNYPKNNRPFLVPLQQQKSKGPDNNDYSLNDNSINNDSSNNNNDKSSEIQGIENFALLENVKKMTRKRNVSNAGDNNNLK